MGLYLNYIYFKDRYDQFNFQEFLDNLMSIFTDAHYFFTIFLLESKHYLPLFDLNYTISYLTVFFYVLLLFIVTSLLLGLSFLVSPKLKNNEKNSPYECGFNPFEDTRSVFEIHFYKVAILFIIFDLEIAFLLPWVMIYNFISFFGFWVITIFLIVLIFGFIYELMTGSLDWE